MTYHEWMRAHWRYCVEMPTRQEIWDAARKDGRESMKAEALKAVERGCDYCDYLSEVEAIEP